MDEEQENRQKVQPHLIFMMWFFIILGVFLVYIFILRPWFGQFGWVGIPLLIFFVIISGLVSRWFGVNK